MPGDDRCQHGMLRNTCALCQAPPEYEMKESTFEGYPIVELLHNGGPIHEKDEHFRFGKSKARLFLACMDIVEELAATQGDERPHIMNHEVVDEVIDDSIIVRMESFFALSDGRRVSVPWVHLQSSKYSNLHIGFGRRKAKAILKLRKQLASWANYPLVDAGIGKSVLVKRRAPTGRNPATGETIKIPAKTVVKIRPAKAFKEAIVPSKK